MNELVSSCMMTLRSYILLYCYEEIAVTELDMGNLQTQRFNAYYPRFSLRRHVQAYTRYRKYEDIS
jgi:hypothetical protein